MIECNDDRCRKIKSARTAVALVVILVIITLPQVGSMLISQTFQKSLYPDNTLVITSRPEASFPQDWRYCHIGDNEISVEVVFHNFAIDEDYLNTTDTELEKCDIDLTYTFTTINEPDMVYFDFEFEDIMNDYRMESDADYVLVFTKLLTPKDGVYDNLGGYARVQTHFAVVFTSRLISEQYISSIALHEMCHLLGYWHSDNPQDVMYPTYSGNNNILTSETVDALYDLHH